jgi:hypothetical protein
LDVERVQVQPGSGKRLDVEATLTAKREVTADVQLELRVSRHTSCFCAYARVHLRKGETEIVHLRKDWKRLGERLNRGKTVKGQVLAGVFEHNTNGDDQRASVVLRRP